MSRAGDTETVGGLTVELGYSQDERVWVVTTMHGDHVEQQWTGDEHAMRNMYAGIISGARSGICTARVTIERWIAIFTEAASRSEEALGLGETPGIARALAGMLARLRDEIEGAS